MNAFFYIDKPSGLTSFDIIREMRKKLHIKKIGHTGTLDPLATGGLLLASGRYTKLLSYLHADIKNYEVDIMLNGTSPSLDRDTEISYISKDLQLHAYKNLHIEDIQGCIKESFLGEKNQIPPYYSALKINGKKSLDRIRNGEQFELYPRKIHIYDCNVLKYCYPLLKLHISVSAGTYIRSIARDIGEKLKLGGYVTQLRRTKVGNLDITLATNFEDISSDSTLNPKILFGSSYIYFIDEEIYQRLSNGQRVRANFEWIPDVPLFLSDDTGIRYVIKYKNGVIHPIKKI